MKLAIDGGKPVRKQLLPYGRQQVTGADIKAVVAVLKSDFLTTGPKIAEFEKAFADVIGVPHAVALSSGTAALHAAVLAAEVKPGAIVTSPLTFAASANCGVYAGLKPAFVDVDPLTWNLNVRAVLPVEARVVVPVHYAGTPADVASIRTKAVVIEDACHALGAEARGERVGQCRHSAMTVFSFHPVKHITTGEGGMVTTKNADLAERLREVRHHGICRDAKKFRHAGGAWYHEMQRLGFNYRVTDVQCALGLSQLKRLDANLRRRREIVAAYRAAFGKDGRLELPPEPAGMKSAWHLFPVALRLERLSVGRERVFDALKAEGLGVNVHYIPVHLHPYYRETYGFKPGTFPVAERLYERLVSLPMFHAMKERDVKDVVVAVRKVLDAYET